MRPTVHKIGFPKRGPPTGLSMAQNRSMGNQPLIGADCLANLMEWRRAIWPWRCGNLLFGPRSRHTPSRRRHPRAATHLSCWHGLRSEPADAAHDVGEQVTRDGDLGHLDDDMRPWQTTSRIGWCHQQVGNLASWSNPTQRRPGMERPLWPDLGHSLLGRLGPLWVRSGRRR